MLISVPRQMESLALLVGFVRDFLASWGLADTSAFELDPTRAPEVNVDRLGTTAVTMRVTDECST
jgi:hypothetical protein